jgi:hypothetical protein
MKPTHAPILALLALASCAGEMAFAQNKAVSGLADRGPIASTDQFPNLPAGAASLQASYAGDMRNYVLTSLNGFSGVDPSGATDSTAGIQAAIASGARLYCNGIYKISATLNLTTAASHGQLIAGAGPTDQAAATTSGRCIFRPTSALTGAVFKIDGTPFGGYVEGFGFENLTVDLANVADVGTNAAFDQVQAFDGRYRGVRVINDGVNKRGWLFNTGAYTTTLEDTQSHLLDFEGTSTANGVTTITVLNHDGGGVIANYANTLKFIGGAFQGATGTKFTLSNGTDFLIQTDIEGGGTYLNVNSSVNFLRSSSELQGFSGTYMTGSPGPSSQLWDNQVNFNAYPANLMTGYFNLNNQGVAGVSSLLSGSAAANYYLSIGRTGLDLLMGVAATANDLISGTSAGDGIVSSWGSGSHLWLGAGQVPQLEVTGSGVNILGQGAQHAGTLVLQPATNTDALDIENTGGSIALDVTPSATPSSSLVQVLNGACFIGFAGNFTGQAFKLCASNGNLNVQTEAVQPATDSAAFEVMSAEGLAEFAVITNSSGAAAAVTTPGVLTAGSLQSTAEIYPGNGSGTQTSGGILAGGGNPAAGVGNNGDFYFRADCTHGSSNCTWHKESGAWVDLN